MSRARLVRLALLLGGLGFMAVLFSCREMPSQRELDRAVFPGDVVSAPRVRVVLKKSAESVTLAIQGNFTIHAGPDGKSHEITHSNRYLSAVRVRPDARPGRSGFVFETKSLSTSVPLTYPIVTLVPFRNGDVLIDGVKHYGSVTLRRVGSRMMVVNNVRLDPYYVAGVLYAEVPWQSWSDEALKAQAIASRTYAFYEIKVRAGKPYDVEAGSGSQHYSSAFSRNVRLGRVVNATLGVILTWRGRVFPAYFHSSCGGHTEDAANVFLKDGIIPLSGVPCGYCAFPANKFRSWERSIPNSEIAKAITPYVRDKLKMREVRDLQDVATIEGGVSKRGVRLRIRHAYRPFEIDANIFRNLVGTRKLPSTMFTCKSNRSRTVFKGRGWGHGVGMCQWGAQGMATQGFNYQRILKHYYPGSDLTRLYR